MTTNTNTDTTMTTKQDALCTTTPTTPTRTLRPRTGMRENAEGFLLSIDMPGVPPDGCEVTLEKDLLTVTGTPAATEREGFRDLWSERRTGTFKRVFRLDETLDASAIEARMKDGVLHLSLKRRVPTTKRIDILTE